MAWTGLVLTVEGRNALNQAQLSNRINFKSIVVGDGKAPANFGTRRELVHQLYEITAIKVDAADGGCTITADFPEVSYDYYFREIGLIAAADAGDILYVYDNCGDDAQYIVSSTGAEKTKKRIRLSLAISDVDKITVSEPQILYVSYDDYEASINRLDAEIEDKETELKEEIDRESRRAAEAEEQLKKDMVSEVSALNEAIGKKANAAEFDSHVKDTVKHVTAAERESWQTVVQTNSPSEDVDYRVLFSGTADDTTRTEGARKSGSLTYDPARKTLKGDSIELRSAENTDGRSAKISGDGMHLFMPEGGYSGGIGYMQDGELVGVLGRWKENDGHYFFCGKNYDNPDGIFRAGILEAGSKASLFTDNEGGNLRLVSPGGITWEIDAYNDNLRFFRYVKGSTVNNACHVAITQDGVLDVPGGIAGIGYIGSTFGQLGCGAITYYGHVTAYGLSGTVILKIGGRVEERSSMSDTDFDLGINLSDILSRLNLNPGLNITDSHAVFFNSDGIFLTRIYGYGGILALRYVDGRKILTPARYYTADGVGGTWASSAEVYSPGTVWTAEVILR